MGPTGRRWTALVVLLALCRSVRGEEPEHEGFPNARAAAEAAVAAHRTGDPAALQAVLAQSPVSPWPVLDEVLALGEESAALAFVEAVPDVGQRDRLRAHLAVWRDGALRPDARESLRIAAHAVEAGQAVSARLHLGVAEARSGESLFAVRLALVRAQIAADLHETASAIDLFTQAAAAALEVGWAEAAHDALALAADLAYGARLLERAEALLLRLHDVQAFLGDEAGRIDTVHDLGCVAWARGDLPRAEERLQLALDAHAARKETRAAARCRGDLAVVSVGRGRALRALDLLRETAEALAASEATAEDLAENENRIGDVCASLGAYERAKRHFDAAIGLYGRIEPRTPGVEIGRAVAVANRGMLALEVGRPEAAREDLASALESFERLGAVAEVATAQAGIAEVIRADAVAEILAAAEARSRGDVAEESRLRRSASGRLEQAVARLNAARATAQAAGLPGQAAQRNLGLGDVYHLLGKHDDAARAYQSAREEASALGMDEVYASALAGIARVRLAQKEYALAMQEALAANREIRRLVAGLPDAWRARTRERFADVFDVGLAAAAALRDTAQAYAFLEAGRAAALLDAMRGRATLLHATAPASLLGQVASAGKRRQGALTDYSTALGTERARHAWKAYEAARDDEKEALEAIDAWAARAAEGVGSPQAESVQRVGARLGPRQALLTYSLAPDEARVLVVTRGSARLVSLGDAHGIRRAVAALEFGNSGPEKPAKAEGLKELLVDPLGLPKETTQVLISPEGELAYVPFALLFPDAIDVAYVPSGTVLGLLLDKEALHRAERTGGVLAAGDPEYDVLGSAEPVALRWGRTLGRLPHTREEVAAITKGKPAVVLLGREASEGRVRQELARPTPDGSKRWRCVHLACHGVLCVERPSDSALALSVGDGEDGLLTVFEVFRMTVPADLVVLSACQTANGPYMRGEGVMGLTRAFMHAGAYRVLVSLWNVDDAATRALMVAFHEAWKPGVPASRALHAAQIMVRDMKGPDGRRKWEDPRYWAAWTLWGLAD